MNLIYQIIFYLPILSLIEQDHWASISFPAAKAEAFDPAPAGGGSQRIGKSDNEIGFFQIQVSYDDVSARTRRCWSGGSSNTVR